MSDRLPRVETEADGLPPRGPSRGLWGPLAIWALGSALAVLAAGYGLRLGLALALAAGLLFGSSAARRVDGRRRRRGAGGADGTSAASRPRDPRPRDATPAA